MNTPLKNARRAAIPPRLQLQEGGHVVHEGRAAYIKAIESPSRILIRFDGTREVRFVGAGDLGIYQESASGVDIPVPRYFSAPSSSQLARAEQWLSLFSSIENTFLSQNEASHIASTMKVSTRTVTRHFEHFLENGIPAEQLPRRPGREPGSTTLSPEVEAVIAQAIEEVYLKEERGGVQATTDRAAAIFKGLGLNRNAVYSTVRSRILRLDRYQAAKKRHGRVRADATAAPAGIGIGTKKALEFVQIDHAIVDVMVVDPYTREEIGRPWITLAIDVGTRCVNGFYLSFDSPSQTSVALALENCVFPKDQWLREMGYDGEWLPFGLMEEVGWDNAKCFKPTPLIIGCRQNGIKVRPRKVRRPRHGAYIERYIGTLMKQIHLLPGTTFSNVKEREDYKSQAHAIMTLEELRAWIVDQINGIYHNSSHKGLNKRTPLEVWREAWTSQEGKNRIPAFPSDRRRFLLDLLPGAYRIVSREGISRFDLKYWDDLLIPFIGDKKRYWVCHNPGNISVVHIRLDDQYLDIPWKDRTKRPIALFELNMAKKALRNGVNRRLSEHEIFKHVEHQRKIVDEAEKTTRTMRRERARRPNEHPIAPKPSASVDYTHASQVTLDPRAFLQGKRIST